MHFQSQKNTTNSDQQGAVKCVRTLLESLPAHFPPKEWRVLLSTCILMCSESKCCYSLGGKAVSSKIFWAETCNCSQILPETEMNGVLSIYQMVFNPTAFRADGSGGGKEEVKPRLCRKQKLHGWWAKVVLINSKCNVICMVSRDKLGGNIQLSGKHSLWL